MQKLVIEFLCLRWDDVHNILDDSESGELYDVDLWTNVSQIIHFDKTDKSKECIICHYWFFEDKNVNFEKLVCNGYHDF